MSRWNYGITARYNRIGCVSHTVVVCTIGLLASPTCSLYLSNTNWQTKKKYSQLPRSHIATAFARAQSDSTCCEAGVYATSGAGNKQTPNPPRLHFRKRAGTALRFKFFPPAAAYVAASRRCSSWSSDPHPPQHQLSWPMMLVDLGL